MRYSTERLPPRGFGSLEPSSCQRCTHLIAALILTSNKSAASRRDAPASTVPITRSRRSPEYDCGIVGPHRRINANRIAHLNGLGNPPIPLDSDSAESALIGLEEIADHVGWAKAQHQRVYTPL